MRAKLFKKAQAGILGICLLTQLTSTASAAVDAGNGYGNQLVNKSIQTVSASTTRSDSGFTEVNTVKTNKDSKGLYIPNELILKVKRNHSSAADDTTGAGLDSIYIEGVKAERVLKLDDKVKNLKAKLSKADGQIEVMGKKYSSVASVPEGEINAEVYATMPVEQKELFDIYKMKVSGGTDLKETASKLVKSAGLEYAEPNYIRKTSTIYDNPNYWDQWSHSATEASIAWAKYGEGSSNVTVAVIDTGVDYNHEDLKANIWRDALGNPGKDFVDLQSYYLDYYKSWGFYQVDGEDYTVEDNDPMDFNGHGTHCAGIVAGADNTVGVVGAAPKARIMPLRAGFTMKDSSGGEYGFLDDSAILKAINYAADNGAKVISMSFGSPSKSQAYIDAIDYADSKGCVLVAAAGNESVDYPSYPGAYDKVIGVASFDRYGRRSLFSNFGYWVDIAAPGEDIISTVPSRIDASGYKRLSGTSMACPYVAGVAAMLFSVKPSLSPWQVKECIQAGTNVLDIKEPYFAGHGKLNMFEALESISLLGTKTAISAPQDQQNIFVAKGATNNKLDIKGYAASGSYTLKYKSGYLYGDPYNDGNWTSFASGTGTGNEAVLGTLNLANLPGLSKDFVLKETNILNGYYKNDYKVLNIFKNIQKGFDTANNTDISLGSTFNEMSSPVIEDMNGDGKKELIASSGNSTYPSKMYLLNSDGSSYTSNWPLSLPVTTISFLPSLLTSSKTGATTL